MLRHRLPAATVAPRCPPTTTITDLPTPTIAVLLPTVLPAIADRLTAVLPLTVLPAIADRPTAVLPLTVLPATAGRPTAILPRTALPATADRLTAVLPLTALPATADRRTAVPHRIALPATADRRTAVPHRTALPATADRPAAAHPAIADLRVHPITDRPVPTTLPPAAAVTPVLPVHPPVQAAVTAAARTPQAAHTPAVHTPAVHPLPEDKISDEPTDYRHYHTNYHNLSLLQNIAGGFFASRRSVVTI